MAAPTRQRALTPGIQAQVAEVWDYYRARIQPKARVYTASKIANRLKTFSVEEIKSGIDHFAADWWWMKNCAGQGANWFFGTDAQIERWINLVPREPEGGRAPGGGDFLESRQPGRADRFRRPGPTFAGKPGHPIDPDVAATADTWTQEW